MYMLPQALVSSMAYEFIEFLKQIYIFPFGYALLDACS